MNTNHWYIAGQGSIGSLAAYNAKQHNVRYSQIVRTKPSHDVWFKPIKHEPIKLDNAITFSEIAKQSIDYLLVPLKAYDVVPFLTQAMPYLAPNVAVVLSHNGLGTIEPVADLVGDTMDVFFCTTSHGLYKDQNTIIQAGIGESKWSHVTGLHPDKLNNQHLADLFGQANQLENVDSILWQKLIINCAINPLTAIHKIKNGALAQPQYQQTITDIITESLKVANQQGINLAFNSMLSTVKQVIGNTSGNYSSMYQDVMASKTTEIDYITGYIVNMAKLMNIDVPVSQSLYHQVKTLNSQSHID